MTRPLASAVAATCATLLPALYAAALPAFPGAEGFGANATGGRGGDVYHVTTLDPDPNHLIPGSLFYGLYEKNVPAAGRTIVFDVGGTISLGSSTLDIKNIKNVTIAGQTAPSPITIINNTTQITSSGGKETANIIIQYLTFRKGLANSGDSLSIKGAGNTHDIMVDHVSASWSEDEVISTAGATNHATNVTVQYSTMSEALTNGHQYGSLIRMDQSAAVTYSHNLYSQNASRNPRPGSYDNTQLDFEFQNNVIYNWSDRAGYAGGSSEGDTEHVNMNYVGNYLIAGPNTVGGPTSAAASPTTGARRNTVFTRDASNSPIDLKVYQAGNKIDYAAGPTRDGVDLGWSAFANWNGSTSSPFPADAQMAARFNYPMSSPDSADDAYAKVLASVGAFPYARSTTDNRLINDVLNYTGTAPLSSPNAAEWAAITAGAGTPTAARPANWDTDRDGMPNAWETLRGFNPSAADNNALMPDGYTRLEKYLHSLTAIAAWNTNADAPWSDYLNWRGTRPNSPDATAIFGPAISAPRTVTLDLPATLGSLTFNSAQSYTLAGPSALTLQAPAGRATIDVLQGSHKISAPLTAASPVALTISPGASLDITTNALLLSNPDGSSPLTTLRQYLQSNQLTSSSSDTTHRLAYTLSGAPTAPSSVVVQLALTGDINLDGKLDADDYVLLDRAFARATPNALWSDGDFNYDGAVTSADYLLLDSAYAQTHPLSPAFLSMRESQFGAAYVTDLLASVPEPSSLACLFAGSALLLPRRRRPTPITPSAD